MTSCGKRTRFHGRWAHGNLAGDRPVLPPLLPAVSSLLLLSEAPAKLMYLLASVDLLLLPSSLPFSLDLCIYVFSLSLRCIVMGGIRVSELPIEIVEETLLINWQMSSMYSAVAGDVVDNAIMRMDIRGPIWTSAGGWSAKPCNMSRRRFHHDAFICTHQSSHIGLRVIGLCATISHKDLHYALVTSPRPPSGRSPSRPKRLLYTHTSKSMSTCRSIRCLVPLLTIVDHRLHLPK